MSKPPHIEVIARALILYRNRLLVCRNLAAGYCYLPGGHIEFGESAAAAAAREIHEETGLPSRVGPCVLITEGRFEARGKLHHEMNVVFHVELEVGEDEIHSQEPDIGFDWIDLASLNETDLRPIEIKAWIMAGRLDGGCTWVSGFPAAEPQS